MTPEQQVDFVQNIVQTARKAGIAQTTLQSLIDYIYTGISTAVEVAAAATPVANGGTFKQEE